jgi:hypothetical protein
MVQDYSRWSSSRSRQSCSTLLSPVAPKDWTTKPVKHAVQQLASQEAGTVFGEKYADRDKAEGESRFIVLINKREKHLCRSIRLAQSQVYAVCSSPDGSQLARAEGSEVVRCIRRFCSDDPLRP